MNAVLNVRTILLSQPVRDRAPALQNQTFFSAEMYTHPDLLPFEQTHIFRRTWQYVGDAAALKEPGSVLVRDIAGSSILITRGPDQQLRAFHNVCPHRASPLQTEMGDYTLRHLVCPYHGWVYTLEGQLIGTPAQSRFPEGFCQADFPLRSVRLETWSNFMFVCFDDSAPALADYLNPIPQFLGNHRTPTTQLTLAQNFHVRCNWKNFHDNTLCDYHVAIAHRKTLSPLQGPVRRYQHEFSDYVNLLYTPTTPEWRAQNNVLEALQTDYTRHGFFTYGIFPNLHLAALPNGQIIWIQIIPLTVDTCTVKVEVFGTPGISPSKEELAADFGATTQEDIALTEGVQRGYASGAYVPGIANRLEDRILHQQRIIRRYLLEGLERELAMQTAIAN